MPKTITVSYSELDTFRQCPLKHALAYKQRWTRPPAPDGALAKGTAWHQALETHYGVIQAASEGKSLAEISSDRFERKTLESAHEAVAPLFADPRTGEQTEVQELIEWMYQGYVEAHGIDSQWQITSIEQAVKIPLHTRAGAKSRFRLKAKLDLVVKDRRTGLSWVVDHKSGKDLPKQQELDLDDQFGLYTAIMARIGLPVQGAVHNAARTYRTVKPQPLESRFGRTFLNRTPTELANIEEDALRVARVAYSRMNDQPYSSPDPRQCGWKCDFREAHLLSRKGRDVKELLQDFGFVQDFTRH